MRVGEIKFRITLLRSHHLNPKCYGLIIKVIFSKAIPPMNNAIMPKSQVVADLIANSE